MRRSYSEVRTYPMPSNFFSLLISEGTPALPYTDRILRFAFVDAFEVERWVSPIAQKLVKSLRGLLLDIGRKLLKLLPELGIEVNLQSFLLVSTLLRGQQRYLP